LKNVGESIRLPQPFLIMQRSGRRQFNHDEWADLKRRFKYRCVRCGVREDKIKPETRLTADHVTPVAQGGPKGIGNIQPLCQKCNQTKGASFADYRWRKFRT
jgi:5-methylcytosine-specific restriction endonuclease McrA